MPRTLFYRRRFLNRRGYHAGAYVLADITVDRARNEDQEVVEALLTISDCSRVMTLDFYSDDRRSMANALYKAKSLQTVVNDFVAALEAVSEETGLR